MNFYYILIYIIAMPLICADEQQNVLQSKGREYMRIYDGNEETMRKKFTILATIKKLDQSAYEKALINIEKYYPLDNIDDAGSYHRLIKGQICYLNGIKQRLELAETEKRITANLQISTSTPDFTTQKKS